MIYTVTLNPAIDKTVEIDSFTTGGVNRVRTSRTDPGGKGINVSKVIRALGGESVATGFLAGQSGEYIQSALEELGIAHSFLHIPGETRTNLKIVDPVRGTNTDINEPGPSVSGEDLGLLLERLAGWAGPGDIVILSGSLPKNAPAGTYRDWIRLLRQRGAAVFLDSDGEALRLSIGAAPTLIKPNREELGRLLGRPLDTLEERIRAGRELTREGIEMAVISLGEDGALFVSNAGVWLAEGLAVDVRSTVGAGDSMVAALALSRAREYAMEDTIRLAMAVSAAKVMCSGSQAPQWDSVSALLHKVTIRELE